MFEQQHYWTRNSFIIDDPKVNIKFSELLKLSEEEIDGWVDLMRSRIAEVWDKYDCPPLNGKSTKEIVDEMNKMNKYQSWKLGEVEKDGSRFPLLDLEDGQPVIINNSHLGSCCNQFFPTMMKSRINYSSKTKDDGEFKGYSVYDYFTMDKFKNSMRKGCRRHFRRDSFYCYSKSVERTAKAKTGYAWVRHFKHSGASRKQGFWLCEVDPNNFQGSGYTTIDANKFLSLSPDEVKKAYKEGYVDDFHLCNVKGGIKKDKRYAIRHFRNNTRIFPEGFRAFRIGYIQVAVNFPPMIAKYLWEKYTKHLVGKRDKIYIYDPSAGWGGRILGAMCSEHPFHYIGTDPNTDNILEEGFSRYEYLAQFHNSTVERFKGIASFLEGEQSSPNTYEIFSEGSEEIGNNPKFQKYYGKLDMVFTSPPYFNREEYSQDETQSLKRFKKYESWREGFLRPTLETAASYLRLGGYLLWNIADILVDEPGRKYLPLEEDSKKILEENGVEFVGVEKMALANMPGANRVDPDTGKPTAKNVARVKLRDGENEQWRKFEPIFVFKKKGEKISLK